MKNKTCGDCRFLEGAKIIGICEKQEMPLCLSELPSCSKFEQKVVTNGDVIRQGGNRALAQFAYMSLRICRMCTFSQLVEGRYECTAEHGQSCIDGIEAWLNAPADCVKQNGNHDTQADLCCNDDTQSEVNNG